MKSDYLQLAYLQRALGILQENERVLDQLIQAATAHYKAGLQADVLQARPESTIAVQPGFVDEILSRRRD